MLKKSVAALFDSQTRISWRRLAVIVLGTGLLAMQVLNSEQWLYLALSYVAGDSAEKALAALRK